MKERLRVALAVYLVLRNESGEVLLLRRAGTGWQDGNFSLAAGHVDPGENATSALIREAEEELGIVVEHAHVSLVHVMYRRDATNYVDLYFSASDWTGVPKVMEPDKADMLQWCDPLMLPENTVAVVRQALICIQQGIPFSEANWG